jgi:hypothetical protein
VKPFLKSLVVGASPVVLISGMLGATRGGAESPVILADQLTTAPSTEPATKPATQPSQTWQGEKDLIVVGIRR